MNNINNTQTPNEIEIERVSVFIKKYNNLKGTNYQDGIKSTDIHATDIFCYTPDHAHFLKIQVKKCDPLTTSRLGKGKKTPISERVHTARVGDQFLMRIPNNISLIEDGFVKQKKDISNTILLLDEVGTPPAFLLEETKKKIKTSLFEEVWIICRNNAVFKLF